MMNEKVHVPVRLTLAVIAACLVSFCGLLTETAVNIAFPAIMKDFSVSTKTIQWLTTGNLLIVAMITPLSAFLQKRFRLKHLFIFGTLCFLLGTGVALVSPNFTVLLAARLIQGIGTGVGVPIAFCIILEQIPFQNVGTYMGYGALVSAAAPALGPTYAGIVSIMLTFLGLVYGFANISSFQENPIVEIGAFVLGIVALVFFVKHCQTAAHPLIDIRIFSNLPFTCHLVSFFLINAIMLGISFLLPNYLQVTLLCESMAAGFMLLPGAGLNALMGPFSGAALDKIGAKMPILFGTALLTLGVFLFAIFGTQLNSKMIVIFYILFGIGCGIAFGNTMTIGNLRLPVQQKVYGNTCFNTLMQFAGAVGTSVSAAFVAFAQTRNTTLDYTTSTALGSTHSFFFLFVLAAICLALQSIGFYLYERNRVM